MNKPNPLVPQGSLQELKNKKANVSIAFFTILAVHVVLLGVLLMQGCKREDATSTGGDLASTLPRIGTDTNLPAADLTAPPFPTTTAPPTDVVMAPPGGTTAPPTTVSLPPTTLPPLTPDVTTLPPSPTATPPAGLREYTIAKGDSFYIVAKKMGTTTSAIKAANPGVDPNRLKIGSKISVPAASAAAPTTAPGFDFGGTAAAGTTYKVKSGDTLTKIAKSHGTTVSAIRSLNNLKTTGIKVGQTLKIPAKATPAPAGVAPAPMGAQPLPGTPGPTDLTLPPPSMTPPAGVSTPPPGTVPPAGTRL